MSFLKTVRVAALGRIFMGALFVGTLWMAGAGCEVEERGGHEHDRDHDRHVEEIHVDHVDHDHHY